MQWDFIICLTFHLLCYFSLAGQLTQSEKEELLSHLDSNCAVVETEINEAKTENKAKKVEKLEEKKKTILGRKGCLGIVLCGACGLCVIILLCCVVNLCCCHMVWYRVDACTKVILTSYQPPCLTYFPSVVLHSCGLCDCSDQASSEVWRWNSETENEVDCVCLCCFGCLHVHISLVCGWCVLLSSNAGCLFCVLLDWIVSNVFLSYLHSAQIVSLAGSGRQRSLMLSYTGWSEGLSIVVCCFCWIGLFALFFVLGLLHGAIAVLEVDDCALYGCCVFLLSVCFSVQILEEKPEIEESIKGTSHCW